ncbi:hypothetical protein IVA86_07275, partial [Bradyrhizobium sp. 146]
MDTTETKPKRIKRTPEQRLTALAAETARVEAEIQARDEREAKVVGAVVIRWAYDSPANAKQLVSIIDNDGLPDVDLRRVTDLLGRL